LTSFAAAPLAANEAGFVMTVIPSLDARPLGEMNPGALVRFGCGAAMLLGIVAGCDFYQISSGKVILMLGAHPEDAATKGRFMPIDGPMVTEATLSYDAGHGIVVAPDAPVSLDTSIDGALLVGPGTRAVRTRLFGRGHSDTVPTIDTGSWQAVRVEPPHAPPWRVAVLAWELRLLTDPPLDPPLPSVFTFRAEG
jgi:hypothetical protein